MRARRARRFRSAALRLDEEQRALEIGEVAGVEHLNAGVVVAVERRHIGRASGVGGVERRVEPQAEMEGVDRIRDRVLVRIGKRTAVDDRRGDAALRDDERLFVEAADKTRMALAVLIGLDVALVPRQPERRAWLLNDE